MAVLHTVWAEGFARCSRKTHTIWLKYNLEAAGRHHFSHLSTPAVSEAASTGARYRPEDIRFPAYRGHCAKVSVINGATTQMLSSLLVHPAPTSAAQKYTRLASYSFLIESRHRLQKVLFDLAFMKDLFTRMPPALKAMLGGGPNAVDPVMKIENICDIPDTLRAHGHDLAEISSIIWSHAHIDHVGDPSVFPPSTELVVGPGFKSNYIPGYPANPDGMVLDSAFLGRSVRELEFGTENPAMENIGGFRAVDFWGDGSFWVLECPGHTGHHIGALCRTTPSSWVFMGADCCHSVAQLRPSQFRRLPPTLPSTMLSQAGSHHAKPCPCAQLLRLLRTGDKSDKAIYELAPLLQEDTVEAQKTLQKLKAFDGREDVMVILAHDASFLDIIDFLPRSINDWMVKGWADQARWLFLQDVARS